MKSLRDVLARMRSIWARIRAWRRIRFTSGGIAFTLGTVAVGFAAMNTGNNLLYLVLSLLLAFLALSGVMSETALRGIEVRRRLSRDIHARARRRMAMAIWWQRSLAAANDLVGFS